MNLEFAKIALREACGDRGWEAGAIPRRRERSPFQPPSTEKGETGGQSQRRGERRGLVGVYLSFSSGSDRQPPT
jgi:hypothetical protein